MTPKREPLVEKMRRTMSLLQGPFAILYLAMAYFVITKKWFMVELTETAAYAFGGLLIIYGLYRLYRSIAFLREYFGK